MTQQIEQVRAHVMVSGRVQGVSFRMYTRDQARKWGIKGWVRNREDGRVEAVFEGDRPGVEKLIEWCHQGPSSAWVEHVEVEWEAVTGQEGTFEVRH